MSNQSYSYQARDARGKKITGERRAASEQELLAVLQEQGLTPLQIAPTPEETGLFKRRTRISPRDLLDFTEGLTTMSEAHVPIDKSLAMLAEVTTNPEFKKVVDDLRREVKEGKSLHGAMESHPAAFSPIYRNMVRAGEEGGILDLLLPRLLRFLEDTEKTKRQVLSAMVYPVILLVVGTVSVLLLLTLVVPRFAVMFEDAGAAIPASAAFLLGLSRWLAAYGWSLLFLPAGCWYLWTQVLSAPQHRPQRDKALLGLPLLGNILLYMETASFSKTLGALLGAGIPLLKALRIAGGVVDNLFLRHNLKEVELEVSGGNGLGRSLAQRRLFPKVLPQLVMVGEESGKTAAILSKLSDHFEDNARQRINRAVALLEPLLILLLGFFVGGIVLIMLSAVFSLNEVGF